MKSKKPQKVEALELGKDLPGFRGYGCHCKQFFPADGSNGSWAEHALKCPAALRAAGIYELEP